MGSEEQKKRPAAQPVNNLQETLRGYYLEEIKVGMSAVFSKTVTAATVELYAGISGDVNPNHLSEEFSKGTRFQTRIAHGMLTASFISAILGTKLPGPGALYMSQNSRFMAPVRIGDTVNARAQVTAIDRERNRVTMKTECFVGETLCLDGEALMWVPSRADT